MVFKVDITQWLDYEAMLAEVSLNITGMKRRFLESLGRLIIADLLPLIHDFTGTYRQSLRSRVSTAGVATLNIELIPTGGQAERLPIYWQVLEHGSNPVTFSDASGVLVPAEMVRNLTVWAGIRLGNPSAGKAIATSIARRGVRPNPILSHIFVFSGGSQVVGVTPRATELVKKAGAFMFTDIEAIFFRKGPKAGQTKQVVRRGAGGRFVPLNTGANVTI